MVRLEIDGMMQKWRNWLHNFKNELYGQPYAIYSELAHKYVLEVKWYRVSLIASHRYLEDTMHVENNYIPKRFKRAYHDFNTDTWIFILQPFHIIVPWIRLIYQWYHWKNTVIVYELEKKMREK